MSVQLFIGVRYGGSSASANGQPVTESGLVKISFDVAAIDFNGEIVLTAQPDIEGFAVKLRADRFNLVLAPPVEAVGEAQNPAELADLILVLFAEVDEILMARFRFPLAVIAGDVGNQFALLGSEAEEVGVADQVIAVLVMSVIADEVADIM